MGSIITYMKVQPFIATLAGMWFARGLCFFISDDAIAIRDDRVYTLLGQTKILVPGLSDPVAQTGDYVSVSAVVGVLLLVVVIYVAHHTRFGRTVYAIGGAEGRNEVSARLMGLPVDRVKVLVYTFNGFCSALAGIVLSIFVLSGHGLYANGAELDVIASVVMGGTMLAGGEGYVFGTLFGTLIFGITQTLIQFNGNLSSWWTRIVIGVLTLLFIGVQSALAARRGETGAKKAAASSAAKRKRQRVLVGAASAVAVIIVAAIVFSVVRGPGDGMADGMATPQTDGCERLPFRQDEAAEFVQTGAVVVYERNGGSRCVDELYAIYADGRIVGDNGEETVEAQVTPEEVDELLSGIAGFGFFTDEMYNTWHTPCRQCFGHYVTVTYQGEQKTVRGVDGGTDAPSDLWSVTSLITGIVPDFSVAP